MTEGVVHQIPLKEIKVSEFNVRQTDKNVGIEELAASIDKHGLLQPVVLQGEYGKPPYSLIVGQRRFLAHKFLNKAEIGAVFVPSNDEWQMRMLSLSENMHRVDLNYADKAGTITKLYNHFKGNANRVAKEIGVTPQTIYEYVNIEEQATPKAKELLRTKKLSKEDVKRAIKAAKGNPDTINFLLDEMPKLTKYEKDRAVDFGVKNPRATGQNIVDEAKKPHYDTTVIVPLDEQTEAGLKKAVAHLNMNKEQIAKMAITEWLKQNGFLGVTT